MPPETPQIGLGAFFFRGRGNRDDLVLARIDRAGDAADGAAFAGCIVALEDRHHGDVLESRIARQHGQFALVFFQFLVEFLLLQLLREIERLQDVQLVDRGQQRRGAGIRLLLLVRLRQPLAQGFENDFAHGQAAIARVRSFDDDPRRFGGAGMADDAFVDGQEFVVTFVMFPVALGDAPAGLGIAFQQLEALFLHFLGQVQPEFDDERTLVGQHLLQALGAFQALVEFGEFGQTHHAIQDRPGVPGTEEHADLALGRERAPEAPHHRPLHFLVGGIAHAVGLDETRIHPFVEQVHGLPAPRPIDAAHQNDDREFGLFRQIELRVQQRLAQLRHFLVVGRLVYLVSEFGRFKHDASFLNYS